MNTLLAILLTVYLVPGFLYAIYILVFGHDKWYSFLINFGIGTPYLIVMFLLRLKKKYFPENIPGSPRM